MNLWMHECTAIKKINKKREFFLGFSGRTQVKTTKNSRFSFSVSFHQNSVYKLPASIVIYCGGGSEFVLSYVRAGAHNVAGSCR